MGNAFISQYPSCDNGVQAIVEANNNYGYHFVQWSDGDTNNPRTLTLTQDTAFTALFDKNTYSITSVPSDIVKGYAGGTGIFEYLDTATLTATANYGYHFTMWSDGNTDNPRQVQVTRDSVFTAQFDYNQYSIALAVDTTIHGNVSGAGNYNYLSERIISATPNYGYHFTQWNDGDTNNPRTLTLTQDTTFTALFENNTYRILALSNDTIKGIVNGTDSLEYLGTATLTATANYGYHFTMWSDGVSDNPRQVQVTRDSVFTAQFDYNQYSIALAVDTTIHGNVSGAGNYNYLSERIISATPNYGYHFTQWNDGDTNNPRTLTLTQDTVFTAYFDNNIYHIIGTTSQTARGYVTGSGTVFYLDTVVLTATANYGYHFQTWNDNNTENPRAVVATGDITKFASFAYNQYTITLNVDTSIHGTCTGGGSYNYLSNRTIRANANYGYHFTHWNDGVTDNPRTISLTQDTVFVAYFAPNQYTLTVDADEHGSATGGGSYNYGDTVTIQAFPDDHYHFVRWSDGSYENPHRCRITGDMWLTASFAINTYTVTVVSNDILRGSVESSGTQFVYGTPCTVTATAYSGYTFAGWSNGATYNPYVFAVAGDMELTALFIIEGEKIYTVTLQSANPSMGTVSGGGRAIAGWDVVIKAKGKQGYRFVRWNDNNTDSIRTVHVSGDITYTAYFESTAFGIDDVESTEAKPIIFARDGNIIVREVQRKDVRVYDMMGRRVAYSPATEEHDIPMPTAGVYLVKVGTLPARKVVVIR